MGYFKNIGADIQEYGFWDVHYKSFRPGDVFKVNGKMVLCVEDPSDKWDCGNETCIFMRTGCCPKCLPMQTGLENSIYYKSI